MLLNCLLENTLESLLDSKEIQLPNTKGNQPWTFIGGTDAEAEASVLWLPDVKSWHWKRPWCWERFKAGGEGDNRVEDGWMDSPIQWTWVWAGDYAAGDYDAQGSLVSCRPWGHKELDMMCNWTTTDSSYSRIPNGRQLKDFLTSGVKI